MNTESSLHRLIDLGRNLNVCSLKVSFERNSGCCASSFNLFCALDVLVFTLVLRLSRSVSSSAVLRVEGLNGVNVLFCVCGSCGVDGWGTSDTGSLTWVG